MKHCTANGKAKPKNIVENSPIERGAKSIINNRIRSKKRKRANVNVNSNNNNNNK